jgi:hypothetical protein
LTGVLVFPVFHDTIRVVRTKHPDGKITDESAFETDVWVKQAAGWKLGHVHYSVTPAK